MGDSYLEVLVKRKMNFGPLIGRNILIGLGALMLVLGVFTPLFILFLLAAVILFLLAWLCHRQIYIEYEYLYLDKTLSVDKISNRSSRKKLAEYSMENMEIFAPASSHRLDGYAKRPDIKTVDYSSRENEEGLYAMIVREGARTIRVLLEGSDELYDQMRMGAPGKVFKD